MNEYLPRLSQKDETEEVNMNIGRFLEVNKTPGVPKMKEKRDQAANIRRY